jgi:hypothetical protein
MSPERAETIALAALGWIAGNDALLPLFLGSTGATLADMRERAGEAAFLAGVLDFLIQNDAWILAFAAAEGLQPQDALRARHALPGQAPARD